MIYQRHHKFSQTKSNRKKYGKLIDDNRNIQIVTVDQHMKEEVKHYNEREFCRELEILDCRYCACNFGKNTIGCIHNTVKDARECRTFYFDKRKYKG